MNINVLDVTGRIVYQKATEKETGLFSQILNLSELPSGMYVLNIENNGNREYQKFMVK